MEDAKRLAVELADILRKKKQYLLRILNYTQLQSTAIEDQDDDMLNEYIEEKQKAIAEVDKVDLSFVDKYDKLKSALGVKSLDEVNAQNIEELKQVRFELDGIYMLLEQIFSIEKENSTKINKEFDDIKNKLKEINGEKRLNSAYGMKPQQSGGVFFDTKK